MPPRTSLFRIQNAYRQIDTCVFCQTYHLFRPPVQSFTPTRRRVSSRPSNRSSAQYNRIQAALPNNQEIAESNRNERQGRTISFKLLVRDKVIKTKLHPEELTTIVEQVLEGKHVNDIVRESKEKVQLAELSHIARLLQRIPPSNQTPGALNHNVMAAFKIWKSCAAAGEPNSTMILMNHQLRNADNSMSVNFTPAEQNANLKRIEHLAQVEKHPEAMYLLGCYLESEGRTEAAMALYKSSLAHPEAWEKDEPSGMAPIGPWISYGTHLMKKEKWEEATKVFEFGAFKADDPLAYFYLARMTDPNSELYLQCMTKAAMAGHTEAQYHLGKYYLNLPPPPKRDPKLRKVLDWLSDPKKNLKTSNINLAIEWFLFGERKGYKPSILEHAKLQAGLGNLDRAIEYAELILKPQPKGVVEQFPQTVAQAKSFLRQCQERQFPGFGEYAEKHKMEKK